MGKQRHSARMSKSRQKKAARDARMALRCIYCGSRPDSVEHIVATRFIEVLAEDPRGLPIPVGLNWTDPRSGEVRRLVGKRTKDGQPTLDFTARVCKTCNNEWMNRVDDAAFPFVSEMIRGNPITLDAAAQCAVATWFAKVAITSRFSLIAPAPLEAKWATDLYRTASISPLWHVWLGTYDGNWPLWYVPEDVRVEKAKGAPPFLEPPEPNAAVLYEHGVVASLALGHLFLQMIGFSGVGDPELAPPVELIEVWPSGADVKWPTVKRITDENLVAIGRRISGANFGSP